MAIALPPPSNARPVVLGAVGGLLAVSLGLVVAAVLAAAGGHAPVAVLNSVGAWWVRWLQVAAPQALDSFYWDASLGGLLTALAFGGLVGAVVGGMWARHAGANALAWGLAVAVVAWALTRWVLAPALSPILNAVLPPPALAGVSLTFGLGLGLWLGAARPPVAGHP